MNFKLKLLLVLTFILITSYTRPTAAYCSLERMKKFAIEACEHLFLEDDVREKRSLGSKHHMNDVDGFIDDRRHFVSRSNYPAGGYLKVDRVNFNRLSQVDVFPRYKARKMHLDKHKRYKRERLQRYENLPYCCFHQCKEDFFCPL